MNKRFACDARSESSPSRRLLLGVVVAALSCLSYQIPTRGMPIDVPVPARQSPTGRNPKLLWTAERQGVWTQMKADFDSHRREPVTMGGPWYGLLKANAECGCRYGDNGLWATLMYQITGDPKYVELAWKRIAQGFLPLAGKALGGNFAREYSAELVVMYDWLYPGLSDSQRRTLLDKLNEMFTGLVQGNKYTDPAMPIRTADTDQTTGSYFGLAFLSLATGDHNPTARTLFAKPFVGGLDATGTDRATLRGAIRQYVTQLAEGGEWMESAEYNRGTVRLLLMGAEGVRTATGVDHFPEVTRFARQAALRQLYVMTPDLKNAIQWGDEQHPRDFIDRLFSWQTTNGLLAGLTAGDPASGPYIQQLVFDLTARYGPSGYHSAEPWARFFLFFSPYAPKADYRTLPLGWFAEGQGLMTARNGWTPDSSLVSVHMPRQQDTVDHQVSYFGDFQIYRKGAWVVTHPLSYAGESLFGEGTNAMVIGSFSSMAEFKQVTAHEFGPRGEYAYIAGSTGGQKAARGAYDPPPTFLHEWTRSILYLPSADTRSDTLVVYDRTNAQNPAALSKFDRYRARGPDEQGEISRQLALKQWIVHMPVKPALTGDGVSWSTPEGQHVKVSTLLPVLSRTYAYDERELWPATSVPPAERRWQVRIVPADERQWDTFLNVVQAYDSAADLSNVLLRSDSADAEGVLLRRAGLNDALVMFNAQPGQRLPQPNQKDSVSAYSAETDRILKTARLRSAGYSIHWTAGSARTDAFLFDLRADLAWTVSVDAAEAVPLSVSTQGVARLTLTGAGGHAVRVTAVSQN